jgi:hypothetical protein
MRIRSEQNVRCFCSRRMPGRKPRTGRDSIAQGAAQRSPGLTVLQSAKAPTGRDSISRIALTHLRNLGPLGLAPVLFRIPRAAPARPAPPWAIESRPLWGFREQSRNKNTQCRQEQNSSITPDFYAGQAKPRFPIGILGCLRPLRLYNSGIVTNRKQNYLSLQFAISRHSNLAMALPNAASTGKNDLRVSDSNSIHPGSARATCGCAAVWIFQGMAPVPQWICFVA